jgi:6-phosphogluconolactonase (cycloisomerase 2 family)
VQTGHVTITYTLTGDAGSTDISVKYSRDGLNYVEAAEAPAGDGTRDLSVSPTGEVHTFVWDTGENLGGERVPSVYLKVTPQGGTGDTTASMRVHNVRYLGAVENPASSGAAGRFRLYSLDAVNGRVRFLQAASTGGLEPHDVIYDDGIYFVANETSNNIAVLQLDGVQGFVLPVAGSPFAAGISRPRHLATDGTRVFASGAGDSIGVLARSESSHALSFRSSAYVGGCRGLAVRSGYLYVASETRSEIAIFEIEDDGTLLSAASSPVVAGGLLSPRSLMVVGTRVYAAGTSSASLAGFNVLGGGGLAPIAGSPFALSSAVGEALAESEGRLCGVAGTSPSALVLLSIDAFGGVAEDPASPLGLSAPAHAVSAVGSVIAVATTSDRELATWTRDATGAIAVGESSPYDTQVELLRMVASD